MKKGYFWHSFEAMGEALGKSGRQMKRDMAKLESIGLVAHVRRGNRESNVYTFLFHPMFSEVEKSPSDGTSMSHRKSNSKSYDSQNQEDNGNCRSTGVQFGGKGLSNARSTPVSDENSVENAGVTGHPWSSDATYTVKVMGRGCPTLHKENHKRIIKADKGRHSDESLQVCSSPSSAETKILNDVYRVWIREEPPEEFAQKCCMRTYGYATAKQIVEYFVSKFFEQIPDAPGRWRVKRGYRRNTNYGPCEGASGYAAWFYAVIGDHFNPAEQYRSLDRATREHIAALEASA
jgi:hypothetical protein